ncbi:hypothetical protein EC973_001314 [Apophysomyces ossiformis]|uniref:Helicase ATP-binding domain-containing protein n=1 Tax=Apophysomyces ossiformis TaxID=679940 RepID=A0A8H7BXZ0_9FUNG|nr:hypothetical protein EC973_001314 [Apophysomyces ossiformis]
MLALEGSVCHLQSIQQWLLQKQDTDLNVSCGQKRPANGFIDEVQSKRAKGTKRCFVRTVDLTRIRLIGDMSTAIAEYPLFPLQFENMQDTDLVAVWQHNALEDFEYATLTVESRDGMRLLDNELLRSKTDSLCDRNVAAFFELAKMDQEQIIIVTDLRLTCKNTAFIAEMTVRVDIDEFRSSRSFRKLLNLIYPCPVLETNATVHDFLKNLQPPVSTETITSCIPDDLVPTLTPFQSQNVQWMLGREGHVALAKGDIRCIPQVAKPLPFLWERLLLDSNQTIYVNRVSNEILTEWTAELEYASRRKMRGGILADEMGLGKTLHPDDPCLSTPSADFQENLPISKATLIISSRAIFQQWESEIGRHAPHLRVMVYNGIKAHSAVTPEDLSRYDVVLTDYEASECIARMEFVLQREVYYARPKSDRPRRHVAKYPIETSPLVKVRWWRCMLDEAQMVESSVAHTAEMARLIPRIYSWAITGTPMGSRYDDLFGLYLFLGLTPCCIKANVFRQLHKQAELRGLFWEFTKETMRRNMKALLQNQVHIPPQQRWVVHVSFSAIEKHRYDDLWDLCCEETSLDWLEENGWNFHDNHGEDMRRTRQAIYAKLRSWLLRLRQTCVHPGVGGYSKRQMDETVRTLQDVLDMMIQQSKEKLDKHRLSLFRLLLHRGGMYEVLREWETSLRIYLEALPGIEEMVDQATKLVEQAKENEAKAQQEDINGSIRGKEVSREKSREVSLTSLVNTQRIYLQLLHQFCFFIAGLYHELGKSDDENLYYDKAATCRKLMLAHAKERVSVSIEDMEKIPSSLDIEKVQMDCTSEANLNITQTHVFKRINMLCGILNDQLSCIAEWRNSIRTMLCIRLEDQEEQEAEDEELEAYQKSLVAQEECGVYQDAYKDILQDRNFLLNGPSAATQSRQAPDEQKQETYDDTASKEQILSEKLRSRRIAYMPSLSPGALSIRQIITELRDMIADPEVSDTKRDMCRQLVNQLNKAGASQKNLQEELESEYRRFTTAYNARVEYYRSLQTISDRVMAWESGNPKSEIQKSLDEEKKLQANIAEQTSRYRYLQNLAEHENKLEDEDQAQEQTICLICQTEFSKGIITYCTVNIALMLGLGRAKSVRNVAPLSKDISGIPLAEIKDRIDGTQALLNDTAPNELLAQIGKCRIKEGLGAKMDSIVRHIKFIKETTNGKCVVFSQWSQVLNLLAESLQKNGIGFVDFAKSRLSGGLTKFREDPETNVILLHARSHSSGLSLVCAQTVFIVEPVLNEVLEKQAISRIHRIGQTKETSVFWYIVRDTIEERIQLIHNEKQRLHSNSETDGIDEATISKALEKISSGGGEHVFDEDLRRCFSKEFSFN